MFASHSAYIDPIAILNLAGVVPESVDHVVLSHLHLDHVGNVDKFPNATFSLARKELEFWTGHCGSRHLLSQVVHPIEIENAVRLLREDRLHLVEDSDDLYPGISVTRIGGHTPGQLITEVAGLDNRIVLASDAVHFYEEYEADRPFWLFSDIAETYQTLEHLRELDARPDVAVIPGHDPLVGARFSTSHDGAVVNLNEPAATTPHGDNVAHEVTSPSITHRQAPTNPTGRTQ